MYGMIYIYTGSAIIRILYLNAVFMIVIYFKYHSVLMKIPLECFVQHVLCSSSLDISAL